MCAKQVQKNNDNEEKEIRNLAKVIAKRGIEVRRENLSRGYSFRVKSGGCLFSGENMIFLDRRLPPQQQITLLTDYIVDLKIELTTDDIEPLSQRTRKLVNFPN